jgi:endo-1,4-beta-mannosidase
VKYFINRVNTITGIAYKNDPTIAVWELGNEPRCSSDTTGAKLQSWIDEMAAYIKSQDSSHLVSTGEEGFYPSGSVGTDFVKNHSSSSIDLCSAHLYPSWWNLTLDQATAWIEQHAKDAHDTLGKPFFLGEFGWNTANGGVSGRNTAYTAWYNKLDTTNSDGANFWILSGLQDDGTYYQDYDGFTTYITDTSTCNLISAFSTKQAAKSGKTLDTTAPTVSISSPSSGGSVSGTVSISGTATDNLGLSKVEVALNGGIWRAATGTSSWSYSWDTTVWINGSHTITARAVDTQNNISTSQITVTVNNGAVTSTSYEITASKSQDDGYWLIYTLHVTNKSSASLTGAYKLRFYIAPEGTVTVSSHYDDSTTYSSTLTASSTFTSYGGGQSYYEIDFGSRTFASGAYIGYKGDIGISTSGFVSSNDWSSSQITGTTAVVINHVTLYKDGAIVAGFQP